MHCGLTELQHGLAVLENKAFH